MELHHHLMAREEAMEENHPLMDMVVRNAAQNQGTVETHHTLLLHQNLLPVVVDTTSLLNIIQPHLFHPLLLQMVVGITARPLMIPLQPHQLH